MSDPASGVFDVTGFRSAAPYINQHRDHNFVIAFGGEAVADAAFANLINDIALLHSLGVKLVLVHGARPQIEHLLKREGQRSKYHDGLRVTDDRALDAVKRAVGSLRVEIEARLSMGLYNTPMAGMRINAASGNFITARPLGVHNGVDFLHTGEVRKVDTHAIRQLLAHGSVVMLSPLGYSPTGETFNLSAEDVAATTASAMQADKLVFLAETDPLRDSKKRLLRQLSLGDAQALLTGKRKLSPAQRRHLEYAVNACLSNVRRVHLLDRRVDGALLK
ncbi:MAG: amino-acid N-acetyltransferase, partial [Gammaproteobacteria bacterium]